MSRPPCDGGRHTVRAIELMHPRDRFPSGGNVYNRELVAAAKARGVALSSRVVEFPEVGVRLREPHAPFRMWDSLFLDALAMHDLAAAQHWGLLLHYLPSANPTLDATERTRLATIEARVAAAASLLVVTGDRLSAAVRAIAPAARIFVCEPGVSPAFLSGRRPSGLQQDRVDLLTVANMVPGKGLLELLVILARLRDIGWRWHIIGDRGMDPEYTRCFDTEVKRLRLSERIRHHGVLEQAAIAKLMDGMDLFVFPSRYEAYGMALAEAAAKGLPAVTTEVGAAGRIYRHGTSALVAPVDDAPGFAAHLERLMTDAALRQRFRDNLDLGKSRTWQDTLDDFLVATGALE